MGSAWAGGSRLQSCLGPAGHSPTHIHLPHQPAATEIPLHSLNKLPYGKLDSKRIGIKEGVVFLTYASLVSQSDKVNLQGQGHRLPDMPFLDSCVGLESRSKVLHG